ncbi:MAG: hypothetical protein WC669_02870 [Patescibacteria group bacterium]|jgi:hypothetical protein
MKNATKIAIVLILFVLENLLLWYIADSNFQNKQYQKKLASNQGLTKACKELALSENLFSILQKMKGYWPTADILFDKVHLSYGDEWFENPGVGLLFNKDYKLEFKTCNDNWEPEDPVLGT